MAFQFFRDALDRLVNGSVDTRMRESMDIGVETMRSVAHVITGYNKSTIGGTYDQRAKVVQFHIDSGYGIYEAARGGSHDFINPGLRAAAKVWGGNFEVQFPNTSLSNRPTALASMRQAETRIHAALGGGRGGLASRTRIHSRRWHKWAAEIPGDPTTPVL
jgi:hypothetical protein